MDDRTKKAVDLALTKELLENERITSHPTYGLVKLHRPTPRMEYEIGEIRRTQYHKDLGDEKILSRKELERVAIRRGMWAKDDSERIAELTNRLGQIMGLLAAIGYETVDIVIEKFQDSVKKLTEMYKENEKKEDIESAIYRYYNLDADNQNIADYNLIFQNAPNSSVEDLMNEVQVYRTQVKLLEEKNLAQKELQPLMEDRARLFKDSLEDRADRTEALGKIYHCITKMDGSKLWKTFESLWDEAPRDIELLMEDMYFFEKGIPDMDRNTMSRHGFTMRAPTSDSSEDSQGSPLPNSDGESVQNEPISSGKVTELLPTS